MPRESCQVCKFFMPLEQGQGVCRRYPPGVVVHPAATAKDGSPLFAFSFPSMSGAHGWCGEFERQLIIDPGVPGARQ